MDEQDLFAIFGAEFIDADGSILETMFSLAILCFSSFTHFISSHLISSTLLSSPRA